MFRRSSRCALASALVAVLVLVPAIAAIDGVVEGHRYCAEHNTLEHIADADAVAVDAGAQPARPVSQHPAALPGHAQADHDACPLVTAGVRQVDATPAPRRAIAAPQPARACLPPVGDVVAPAVSVLSTAPKQSPPDLRA